MKGEEVKKVVCEYLKKKRVNFYCPKGENPDIILPDEREWIEAKGDRDIKSENKIKKSLQQLIRYIFTHSETKLGFAFPLNSVNILFLSTMLYMLESSLLKRGYKEDNKPRIKIYLIRNEKEKFSIREFQSSKDFYEKIISGLERKVYIYPNTESEDAIKKVKATIENLEKEIIEILIEKEYSYYWQDVTLSEQTE